jgi:hypothetical protein
MLPPVAAAASQLRLLQRHGWTLLRTTLHTSSNSSSSTSQVQAALQLYLQEQHMVRLQQQQEQICGTCDTWHPLLLLLLLWDVAAPAC